MFGSIKYVANPNIEAGRPIATVLEKANEIPETHFFAQMAPQTTSGCRSGADSDFVHIVCYNNVYFYGLEAIDGPDEQK